MYLTSSSISKEELEEKKVENKYIFISSKIKKNHVIIKIKDNAHGIENSALPHIFEPYFTTKHKEQGRGIGLYMSNQIITKHLKSEITVQNVKYTYLKKEYKGAEFCIIIPYTL